MDINCWIGQGDKKTLRVPNPSPKQVTALRAAIKDVRAAERASDSLAFELPSSVPRVVRAGGRVVLGLGAVVVTTLLMALVVVGGDTRSTLVPITVGIAVVGGLFVMVVWQLDVSVSLYRDGRLRRSGWGGVTEVNVKDYGRVTISVDRSRTDDSPLGFGGD